MAKTFHEFLEIRARHDYRCARLFTTNLFAPKDMQAALIEVAQLNVQGDAGVQGLHFHLPRKMILESSSIGLNLAGEAVKRIEAQTPEVMNLLSNVPWKALKRLRDKNTHFYRDGGLAPGSKDLLEVQDAYSEVAAYMGSLDVNDITQMEHAAAISPYVRPMMYGIGVFQALTQSVDGYAADESIDIFTSPTMKQAEKMLHLESYDMPAFILGLFFRNRMNLTLDTIDSTSSFFREANEALYRSPKLVTLREQRNCRAHFDDALTGSGLNDGVLTSAYECSNLLAHMKSSAKLKLPPGNDHAIVEAYIDKLTAEYSKSILGNSGMYPEKMAMMDAWVAWVDKSLAVKKSTRRKTEEACVTAAGAMLQKLPAAAAQEVFTFVRAHREALANPVQLIADATDQSKTLQAGVRGFAETMQQALTTEKGSGRG